MLEYSLNRQAAQHAAAIQELQQASGVTLHHCYQCGKCTAGCPLAAQMEITPRQVLRHLQLGLLEDALHSNTPWICAGCHTCSARCPHGIEISELMEALRQLAERQGVHPLRRARIFTRGFLLPLKLFGRSHEMTMTAWYNVFSGRLLQHFNYLPAMLKGRKLRFWPEQVKDKKSVRKIFANCQREAGQ